MVEKISLQLSELNAMPRTIAVICTLTFAVTMDPLIFGPCPAVAQMAATPPSAGGPRFRADGPNADTFGRNEGYPSCKGLAYVDEARCRVGSPDDRCAMNA